MKKITQRPLRCASALPVTCSAFRPISLPAAYTTLLCIRLAQFPLVQRQLEQGASEFLLFTLEQALRCCLVQERGSLSRLALG